MGSTRIIIEPYVQVNLTEKSVLLYNTLSGKNSTSSNPEIVSVFSGINKGVIELQNELSSKQLAFFNMLKKQYIVDVEITSDNKKFPVSSNNNDLIINDFKKINNKEHIINAKEYINTVNIQLSNSCTDECLFCNLLHKQTTNCFKSSENSILTINDIKLITSQINFKTRINLIGGNLFNYPNLTLISNYLKENRYKNVVFYIKTTSLSEHNINSLKELNEYKIVISVEATEILSTLIHLPNLGNKNIEFRFLIDSENSYSKIEQQLNLFSDFKVDFQPFYTGTNIEFFENNVYLNEEDIFSNNQSLKDIKTRNTINTNKFGKIDIVANGDIYFNTHEEKVGNINTDSFSTLIENELAKKENWFKTRKKTVPCKDCLYNNLCPSPSGIELLIEKYDLCNYDLEGNIWERDKE